MIARVTVVSSKSLGPACWSALRAVGGCHRCDRVHSCTLTEATRGRLVLAETALERHLEESERKRKRLTRALEDARRAAEGANGGQI